MKHQQLHCIIAYIIMRMSKLQAMPTCIAIMNNVTNS